MDIKQPSDFVDGKIELKWNPSFAVQNQATFDRVQKFVDSECIKHMKPYTPYQVGGLEKSTTIGTKIGTGLISQYTPYARYQYYGMLMVSPTTGSSYAVDGEKKVITGTSLKYSTGKHPQAGKLWFERMKSDKKEVILRGAMKMIGAK